MYDMIVSIVGAPPAGFEWLVYVAAILVTCTLISSLSNLVVSVMRIPFRGR